MRVKIAYTVDISEVESEVKNLVSQALKDIEALQEKVLFAYNSLETLDSPLEKIIENLEQSRKDLYNIDSVVSDSNEILNGYSQVLKQLEQNEKEKQDEQT